MMKDHLPTTSCRVDYSYLLITSISGEICSR